MTEKKLDDNLIAHFNTVCENLFSILNQTENVLCVEKEKYNKVLTVAKPWPLKKRKSIEQIKSECTCSSKTEITKPEYTSTNEINSEIVDSIPKIVSKTRSLRINPSKNNVTKFCEAKRSIDSAIKIYGQQGNLKNSKSTNIKPVAKTISSKNLITSKKSSNSIKTIFVPPVASKTSSSTVKNTERVHVSPTKKSVSFGSVSNSHDPSCAFYNVSKVDLERKQSYSSLSDAVSAYGVPSSLSNTLKDYHKFLLETNDDPITRKAKNSFLRSFESQNEEKWEETIHCVEKLPKYMSALYAIEEKSAVPNLMPCVIYKHLEDLTVYELNKSKLLEKELWNMLLKYLNRQLIPEFYNTVLTVKEKIYICKIIKSLCNFSESRIPNVPIFRIN